jgi:hypothetical protein
MKYIAVLCLVLGIAHANKVTLREWMKEGSCLNVAFQPLLNTHYLLLGLMDGLRDENALEKVSGYSGVSSGAFIAALMATEDSKNKSALFRQTFPGWNSFGVKDPEVSENYGKYLRTILPEKFEDLKTPTAVGLTKYVDDYAATTVDSKRSDALVVNNGNLIESVVTTSSAMIGPGCPKCNSGFSAKNFRGMWPVADGFLHDEYGTGSLAALPKCNRLMHVMPQNFMKQLVVPARKELDTEPQKMVTMAAYQGSSLLVASMSFDGLNKPLNQLRQLGAPIDPKAVIGPHGQLVHDQATWDKVLYESAYIEVRKLLDVPMQLTDDKDHFLVEVDTAKHWKPMQTWVEKKWDEKFDDQHAQYWAKTKGRRDAKVEKRNIHLRQGKLPALAPKK